jgi:hypothetical protein
MANSWGHRVGGRYRTPAVGLGGTRRNGEPGPMKLKYETGDGDAGTIHSRH